MVLEASSLTISTHLAEIHSSNSQRSELMVTSFDRELDPVMS